MKRNLKVFSVMIMLVFCMALVACSTPQIVTTENAWKGSRDVYEGLAQGFATAHKQGLVTDAQFTAGQAIETQFVAAWKAMQSALVIYTQAEDTYAQIKAPTTSDTAKITQTLTALSAASGTMAKALSDLQTYIASLKIKI